VQNFDDSKISSPNKYPSFCLSSSFKNLVSIFSDWERKKLKPVDLSSLNTEKIELYYFGHVSTFFFSVQQSWFSFYFILKKFQIKFFLIVTMKIFGGIEG
jgi:hypothetical protein